jgi:hypothetical protein
MEIFDKLWKKIETGNIALNLANKELEALLEKYPWFSRSIIENNRLVAYVDYIDPEVSAAIPISIYGYQVIVRYSASDVSYVIYGNKRMVLSLKDI